MVKGCVCVQVIWSENNKASPKRYGIFMHHLFQVFKLCQQEQL